MKSDRKREEEEWKEGRFYFWIYDLLEGNLDKNLRMTAAVMLSAIVEGTIERVPLISNEFKWFRNYRIDPEKGVKAEKELVELHLISIDDIGNGYTRYTADIDKIAGKMMEEKAVTPKG